MAPWPSNVMMLNSEPTGRLFMNLKNARLIFFHRPLTPITEVRSSSKTYRLDRGTIYSNFGLDASLAMVCKIILDGVEGVVVDFMEFVKEEVARYNVDATKVGLVGKNVVGGVTG